MPDLFSRNASKLSGVFTADRAKLTLRGQLGVLVQRLSFTYAQTITRLYEVGSDAIYYVGGRTAGQAAVDRVIGPSGTMKEFYTSYGNVCNARENTISLTLTETDCSTGQNNPISYDLKFCVITQVSIGVQAQDMTITENTTLMYSSLELSATGRDVVNAALGALPSAFGGR